MKYETNSSNLIDKNSHEVRFLKESDKLTAQIVTLSSHVEKLKEENRLCKGISSDPASCKE